MDREQGNNEIADARSMALATAQSMIDVGYSPLALAAGFASASAQIIGSHLRKDAINDGIAAMMPVMTKDAHAANDFVNRGEPN